MRTFKFSKIYFFVGVILYFLILNHTGLVFSQNLEDIMNQDFQDAETLEDYREFIEAYKPNELAFVAVQRLAKPYLDQKNWQEAISVFQNYRENFPGMENRFDKIIVLLNEPEKNLIMKNLGNSINTGKGEYSPILSADGKKLYFCRNNGVSSSKEDVYVSTLLNGEWEYALDIGSPINTDKNEGPLGISADGNTLLLFGIYSGSFGRGDNLYTEKTALGWSEIKHYPEPINSQYFDAYAALSADGKAVLFTSDRPGGVGKFHKKIEYNHGNYWGNIDIYVSTKTDSGWSAAINLGKTINTDYCEYSPFIHPDGKTLYFSSDGHYGLGDLDVFKSTRLSDTSWTEWSEPINLGKEINGTGNDWGYRVTTSGEEAYFSAQRTDGYGKGDIYSMKLPEILKPMSVTTVSGKVTDPAGVPLDTDIKWNDLTLKKEVGEAKSDPQNGDYFIPLPAGHKYSYYAEKEGFIGKSEYLDLTDKAEYTEYTLDIVLYPVKKDTLPPPIELIVFFDVDKWDLREESFLELNRWVKLLKQNEEIQAEIHGHTDNTGTSAHNDTLSENRAQAVVNFLTGWGVKYNQLIAKGFGEQYPVATNETEDGRQKNRRVEIKLIEYKAER